MSHLIHRQAQASRFISICRGIFQTYGSPEELSSDSGPPFTSLPLKQFLEEIQQSGRAVKTAERIVNGNTGAKGSLDNDCARAILQVQKHTYSEQQAIPCATITSLPVTQRPPDRVIQLHSAYPMPTPKGRNSLNTTSKHLSMGHNRSSYWNSP